MNKRKQAHGYKWRYKPDRECPDEVWKPIANHPGCQISTYGRIKYPDGRINDYINKSRNALYPIIKIKPMQYYLHILMGSHFIPKVEGKPFLNHKDGDMWNCHVDNLEWCDKSENAIHAHENDLNPTSISIVRTNSLTGQKRKFRSMRHASREIGKYADWLSVEMKKQNATTITHTHFEFSVSTS